MLIFLVYTIHCYWIFFSHTDQLLHIMEEEGQKARTMYVVLNFSDHEAEFEKPEEWDGAAKYLIGNMSEAPLENRTLQPYEAAVYLKS